MAKLVRFLLQATGHTYKFIHATENGVVQPVEIVLLSDALAVEEFVAELKDRQRLPKDAASFRFHISSQTQPDLAAIGLHNQFTEVLALEDAPYADLMHNPLKDLGVDHSFPASLEIKGSTVPVGPFLSLAARGWNGMSSTVTYVLP